MQGTDDTTVDWRYNLPRLSEKFPAASTHIIDGARHHLVNESEEFRIKLFGILDTLIELQPPEVNSDQEKSVKPDQDAVKTKEDRQ